jgi:hypothetical protein
LPSKRYDFALAKALVLQSKSDDMMKCAFALEMTSKLVLK